MDHEVQAYVDAIPAEHRALFDRIHALILGVRPDAAVSLSYKMPTYKAGGGRLYVAAWKHGVSIYGWKPGRDGGFLERHPELKTSKGTVQLRPEDADRLPDDELRALVQSALTTE